MIFDAGQCLLSVLAFSILALALTYSRSRLLLCRENYFAGRTIEYLKCDNNAEVRLRDAKRIYGLVVTAGYRCTHSLLA